MDEAKINLRKVTKEDISRINQWLSDDKVAENWFGRYSYGDPAHLGYHPENASAFSEQQWTETFSNPEHIIFSIYTTNDVHIGESHIAIEESLGDGQISILIGDREMWHKGYGTNALTATVEKAFTDFGLYRIWADIPEYNEFALRMFAHLGFRHEGTLRKSRPHEGSRYDSIIMGMLSNEYEQI